MTIRLKFQLSTLVTVVLVVTVLGLVLALLHNQANLTQAQQIQLESLKLANELRYSSDELTRTARTYVVTGETKYLDEYWHILAVRNGQAPRPDGRTVPLRQLMQDVGITPSEFALLKTAEDNSNALVSTEVAAFQAMIGHFLPPGAPLTRNADDYTRIASPDQAYAIRIMHDDQYYADKATIMDPIGEFEKRVQARTRQTVDDFTAHSNHLLIIITGFVGVLVLVALGSHFFAQRPVLRSINLVARELDELATGEFHLDHRLRVAGGDEIAALASAFNALLEKLAALVTDVRAEADAVLAGTGEMAGLLTTLQANVEQQCSSTQATSVATREIATTSAELIRTTTVMADAAEKTNADVAAGQSGLDRIGASVAALLEANQQIVAKISVINDRVGQINSMAVTIGRVTDQTNLLSLNAAIEAEKAGEFGLGFGVVAREIRRLADQSAISTEEIESLLREVRRSVDAGVMEMDRFRGRLGETVTDVAAIQEQLGCLISHVQKLLPLLNEVRASFNQQDSGVQQINDAMLALNAKAQATV
ncbi:MAG: methyl-accepting chemotaxis protein, partial [Opitutales bacterium]